MVGESPFGFKADNIYTVGSGSLQMVLEPIPDPGVGVCLVLGTSAHGLLLHSSSSLALQGYTDVDWASCPDDRRTPVDIVFSLDLT
ncbi:hypothetical protein CK203_102509 [Vitis vinifera]|uniref:Uncharacterized protein n=1 Tax=Vitis vinifera TaxID=29760 RepID=A0A438C6Q0_VITVI|nr:hypothetical protein CK203_102509 [Vitis vinifera]